MIWQYGNLEFYGNIIINICFMPTLKSINATSSISLCYSQSHCLSFYISHYCSVILCCSKSYSVSLHSSHYYFIFLSVLLYNFLYRSILFSLSVFFVISFFLCILFPYFLHSSKIKKNFDQCCKRNGLNQILPFADK